MDHQQLSESYAESETSRHLADLEETLFLDDTSHDEQKIGKELISNGNSVNGPTTQEGSWRAAPSSDLEGSPTSDTSFHSSLSISEVPTEVLEGCDGLDDASFYSTRAETLPAPPRGRGRGRGRGRANSRAAHGQSHTTGARRTRGRKDQPSNGRLSNESDSSSSFDTSNSSTDSETGSSVCSETCSHSSCNEYESFTSSELSEETSSYSSHTSCDCPCHSEESSTSFESLDDLTSVPRAKRRGARLGKKGTRKIAEQCQQS